MEYTFLDQSVAFLYSILLGACLSLVYLPFKIIRLTNKPKKAVVIILDVLFMVISAFATFLFAMAYLNGSVRFYMILGEAIGFILLQMTAGRIIIKISVPVNKFIIINKKKILNVLKKIIKKLLKILYKVLYNINEKIYKFVEFFKKHKKDRKSVKIKKKSEKGKNNGRKTKTNRKKRADGAKKRKRSKAA